MALPQHIIYNVGGTVTLDVLSRPTTVSVTLMAEDGSAIVTDASATVDSVSTTMNGAVVAGARTLTLTTAAGVTSGKELWLSSPSEKVRVKSVSGSVATLFAPILYPHATLTEVSGTRLSYAVSAAQANTLFFDGRVEWTLDGDVEHFSGLECTKYPLKRLATANDVRAIEPLLDKIFDPDGDLEVMLDLAHENVLTAIGSRGRTRVYTGAPEFNHVVALKFLLNHYSTRASAASRAVRDEYKSRYDDELAKIIDIVARDDDQDGVAAEPHEKISWRTVDLNRG